MRAKPGLLLRPPVFGPTRKRGHTIVNPNALDLSSDVTFTRSSSAYAWVNDVFTSFATDVPRFGSYELDDSYTGFVTEGAGTNLCLQSQAINTAPWLALLGASVTANSVISPDGTQNADTLTFDAQYNSRVEQGLENLGLSVTVTMSVYLRVASGTRTVRIGIDDSGSYYADVLVTSAWQRFSITSEVLPFVGGSAYPRVSNSPDSAAGDIYVWGWQVEVGSFATTYIPTTTVAVTRAQDVCGITSLNTKTWWNSSEGTFVIDFKRGASVDIETAALGIDDGSIIRNGLLIQQKSSANSRVFNYQAFAETVQTVNIDIASGNANIRAKAAIAYKLNDFAFCVNGGAVSVDTSAAIPIDIINLVIGNHQVGSSLCGTIQSITYYPRRLPNATLQNMTA